MAQTLMLAATRTHFQGLGGFLGGADGPGAALGEPEEQAGAGCRPTPDGGCASRQSVQLMEVRFVPGGARGAQQTLGALQAQPVNLCPDATVPRSVTCALGCQVQPWR